MNAPAPARAQAPYGVLSPEEEQAVRGELWSRLDNDDPLAMLPLEVEEALVKLGGAPFLLKSLEREYREALKANDRTDFARFSLAPFRDEYKRRQLMIKRNDGATEPDGGPQPERASDQNADFHSDSAFLKAQAYLDAYRPQRLWYDDFYKREMSDWDGTDNAAAIDTKDIDRAWRLRVHSWLHRQSSALAKTDLTNTKNAISVICDRVHKNAAKDWLKSLNWDGQPRLREWLHKVYNVEQNHYHERVGINFFVGAAARLMEPGCKLDTMMVLLGGEGIGKSTSLEIIGGDWYAAISTSLAKKPEDFKTSLHGRAIVEVAEMQAFTRAENNAIKELLSTRIDVYRKIWDEDVKEYPRTCVMVSTTNDMQWHSESTGFRRFFPVDCVGWPQEDGRNKVDRDWLIANVGQLWAEARSLFERGEMWHGDELQDEQRLRVSEHTMEDPWLPTIEDWLAIHEPRLYTGPGVGIEATLGDPKYPAEAFEFWGTLITTARVASALKVPTDRLDKKTSNRIAECMRKLGFELDRVRAGDGARRRCWLRAEVDPKAPRVGHIS